MIATVNNSASSSPSPGGAYRRRVFGGRIEEQERRYTALLDAALDQANAEWNGDADEDDNRPKPMRLAEKLRTCCMFAVVQSTDAGDYRIAEKRCKSRLCTRCGQLRCRELTHKMTALVKCMDSPRFLTLTIRSTLAPLRDEIARITKAFKEIRRRKAWKQHVTGGFFAVEVTYNRVTGCWHPHLHAVIDGTYWQQREILAEWEAAVGGHAGVHIKQVSSASSVARYVASYVSKASELDSFPSEKVAEYAVAVHGLRMCQTFGALHAVKISEQFDDADERDDTAEWSDVMPADQLAARASDGDENAEKILRACLQRKADMNAESLAAGLQEIAEFFRPHVVEPPPKMRTMYLPWTNGPPDFTSATK